MLKKIILGIALSIFLAGTANAWYFDLQDQGAGSYEIWFMSDGSATPAFDTDAMALTVAYTGALVSAVAGPNVGDPAAYGGTGLGPFPDVNSGGFYTWTWAALSGTGSIGNTNPLIGVAFNPDAPDLLMASIAVSGGTVDWDRTNASGLFQMNINGVATYAPELDATGKLLPAGAPPIPIPGAIYLLASGLIGLIGLRRRELS